MLAPQTQFLLPTAMATGSFIGFRFHKCLPHTQDFNIKEERWLSSEVALQKTISSMKTELESQKEVSREQEWAWRTSLTPFQIEIVENFVSTANGQGQAHRSMHTVLRILWFQWPSQTCL